MNRKEFKETKKKKSILKSKRGITLIALVVTIVVLLILAGVSISLILDNNGIIQKSKDAKEQYAQSRANEQKELDRVSDWIDETTTDNINWESIIGKVEKNPNNYKHPDQSSTNPDVGIGTDGKPVNLDLWYYRIINSGTGIALNESAGSGITSPGYSNANITDEGTIVGKMPQYIYIYSKNKVYPVVHAGGVFYNCTKLVIAPEFPETVTSIEYAFAGCVNLRTAPTIIPESIIGIGSDTFFGGMTSTFLGCKNLTGNLIINAKPTCYEGCFREASTAEGTNLVVSGSSTMLDEIIATKSDNSNITKGE